MASYLKPRRGKKQTAINQNIILKKGEIFFEVPTTGVGSGIGKIKMGDGGSTYDQLPYFMEQPEVLEVSESAITFTEAENAENSVLINNISSGSKINAIIGNIKRLLRKFDASTTELSDNFGGLKFGSQQVDNTTVYGFYTSDGEFHPFKHWHISPVNNMPDITLTDDYISNTSGGCFTKIKYNNHHHKNSSGQITDKVTFVSAKTGTKGGCYTVDHKCGFVGTGEYDFTSSTEVVCPNCRTTWYDGPYYESNTFINGCQGTDGWTLGCGKTLNSEDPAFGLKGYVCNCGKLAGHPSNVVENS